MGRHARARRRGLHDELARRFERAARACQKRHAEWKDIERRRSRLRELAEEAGRAAALDDLAAARKQFAAIRREWHDLGAGMINDPGGHRTVRRRADRVRGARRRGARTGSEGAARGADPRAAAGRPHRGDRDRADLTLKSGERALKEIRTALATVPQLPSKKDYDEIVKRLKAAQTALMPKVQELRDVADWQRWANVGIQEQLCEKMEALKALEDPEAIAKQVRDAAGAVAAGGRRAARAGRGAVEAVQDGARRSLDPLRGAFRRAVGSARREPREEDRARASAPRRSPTRPTGFRPPTRSRSSRPNGRRSAPVSRGQEKAIWERFRGACDRFFTRRHADLAERKTVWADNLAKKEALCARAEALKESTEWDAAASEMKRLQAEWKTIGPVKKTPLGGDVAAIPRRLRSSSSRATHSATTSRAANGSRRAKRSARSSKALAPVAVKTAQPASSARRAPSHREPESASIRSRPPICSPRCARFAAAGSTELARARRRSRPRAALDERFAGRSPRVIARWPAVFGGTDLDPDANRKRMEALVRRIEDLAKSIAGPAAGAATPRCRRRRGWRRC